MASGPTLPPQAYTREILTSAFNWLQSQPESVKKLATTPDALVGLYMRAQRWGASSLEADAPVSSQSFMSDLKNLAEGLKQFEGPRERQASSAGAGAAAATTSATASAASMTATSASIQTEQMQAQRTFLHAQAHSIAQKTTPAQPSPESVSAARSAQAMSHAQALAHAQAQAQAFLQAHSASLGQTQPVAGSAPAPVAPNEFPFSEPAPEPTASNGAFLPLAHPAPPTAAPAASIPLSQAIQAPLPNMAPTQLPNPAPAQPSNVAQPHLPNTAQPPPPITVQTQSVDPIPTHQVANPVPQHMMPAAPTPTPAQAPIPAMTRSMAAATATTATISTTTSSTLTDMNGVLNERSLLMIQEVKMSLNLSSEKEVLNLMIALAYKKVKNLLA